METIVQKACATSAPEQCKPRTHKARRYVGKLCVAAVVGMTAVGWSSLASSTPLYPEATSSRLSSTSAGGGGGGGGGGIGASGGGYGGGSGGWGGAGMGKGSGDWWNQFISSLSAPTSVSELSGGSGEGKN